MPLLSHTNIIELVDAFVPNVKPGGVCDGFNDMWARIILIRPVKQYVYLMILKITL